MLRREADGEGHNNPHSQSQKSFRSSQRFSFLTLRILVITLFPIAVFFIGVLYIDEYRITVLNSELNALYRQGNTIARTVSLADAEHSPVAQRQLSELAVHRASQLIESIPDARVRIFQLDGIATIDSAFAGQIDGSGITLKSQEIMPHGFGVWVRDKVNEFAALVSPRDNYPLYDDSMYLTADQLPSVKIAISGEVASFVARSEQGKLFLGVAVPIRHLRVVRGALLVTASAEQLEHDIEEVQYVFFQIFAVTLLATLVLGFYLSHSITGPIKRLASAANLVRLSAGQDLTLPELNRRKDEIGLLARDLSAMTDELQTRMQETASFAADVSHEIKNPLTSLRSAVETLALLKDKTQQKKLMAIILDDIGRLDRLITDISAASRLDASLSEAEVIEVDLTDLIQKFTESRQITADKDHHNIVAHIPKTKIMAHVIVDRLVQVLDNLYANAVSFSPKGGTITISLAKMGKAAVIEISDEGIGIPDNKLEDIFSRFYSERPRSESFGTHSGLGLSISRQIIEAHGGTLKASNIIGKNNASSDESALQEAEPLGAKLTITLPEMKKV